MEQVSWDDSLGFAEELNTRFGPTLFALPTEAQWEYACRAGTNSRFYTGNAEASLGGCAWYDGNSGGKTHPVGEKRPNAWGLHDTHGNLWEWCSDWYGGSYYEQSPDQDPEGTDEGVGRVFRGGCWYGILEDVRSARRNRFSPARRNDTYGCRLVCRVQ